MRCNAGTRPDQIDRIGTDWLSIRGNPIGSDRYARPIDLPAAVQGCFSASRVRRWLFISLNLTAPQLNSNHLSSSHLISAQLTSSQLSSYVHDTIEAAHYSSLLLSPIDMHLHVSHLSSPPFQPSQMNARGRPACNAAHSHSHSALRTKHTKHATHPCPASVVQCNAIQCIAV